MKLLPTITNELWILLYTDIRISPLGDLVYTVPGTGASGRWWIAAVDTCESRLGISDTYAVDYMKVIRGTW